MEPTEGQSQYDNTELDGQEEEACDLPQHLQAVHISYQIFITRQAARKI